MSEKQTDIVYRLRGIYTVPVNDGAGLLNGKDTFTQEFKTAPIQHEAATEIESLRTESQGRLDELVRLVKEMEQMQADNARLRGLLREAVEYSKELGEGFGGRTVVIYDGSNIPRRWFERVIAALEGKP